MGAACCVAGKGKPLSDEANVIASRMSTTCSPLWNVRWDNRRRIAGEETAVRWFADMSSRDSQLGNISETEVRTVSEAESSERSRSPLLEEGIHVPVFRSPNSDASISRSNSLEGKEAENFHAAPDRSPMMALVSSVSKSPLPSRDHMFHATNPYTQATDGRMAGFKSPGTYGERLSLMRPGWTNHSDRGSHDESSDSCSIPEYMAYPNRERWSFDSDSIGLNNRDTITRSSSRHSSSPCSLMKTCGACSKILSDKSSFSSQKLLSTNELVVVAVLICGHVYHAECLEHMTLEVGKYDPVCPICTIGEQQTLKLIEKAIKADMESRLKHSKRSRSRIVDSEFESCFVGDVGKGVKIDSSSGTKSSFLKRHFSLGSKSYKPSFGNLSSKKKSLPWSRSTQ